MKASKTLILTAFAATVLASAAVAEKCRSVSTTWEDASGNAHRTLVSTRADNGCKRIHHYASNITGPDLYTNEIRGHDCNCDLVADGLEDQFTAPPSALNSARLYEVCEGPEAVKDSYPAQDPWELTTPFDGTAP